MRWPRCSKDGSNAHNIEIRGRDGFCIDVCWGNFLGKSDGRRKREEGGGIEGGGGWKSRKRWEGLGVGGGRDGGRWAVGQSG